ncbi:unnamed protein product, partial [Didymodactylos carnosus]
DTVISLRSTNNVYENELDYKLQWLSKDPSTIEDTQEETAALRQQLESAAFEIKATAENLQDRRGSRENIL